MNINKILPWKYEIEVVNYVTKFIDKGSVPI